MTAMEFLEYLHGHPATTELAEALCDVIVLRGRHDLVPAGVTPQVLHQVAS